MSAATLWRDRAIPRVRFERSNRAIASGTVLTRGQVGQAVNTFLTLPGTLNQQASWEFDLAMCDLEAGLPEDAAAHFTKALTLAPDLAIRPIAAYYLEKMSKPVPASKNTVAKTAVAGSGDKLGLSPGALATQASPTIGLPIAPSAAKPPLTQSGASKETAKSESPEKPAAAPR